jgi:hypothetical protein
MNSLGTLPRPLSVELSGEEARSQLACTLGDVDRPCPRPATVSAFFHSCEFVGHRLVVACQGCVDEVLRFAGHPTRCTGCGRRMNSVGEWIHGIGEI